MLVRTWASMGCSQSRDCVRRTAGGAQSSRKPRSKKRDESDYLKGPQEMSKPGSRGRNVGAGEARAGTAGTEEVRRLQNIHLQQEQCLLLTFMDPQKWDHWMGQTSPRWLTSVGSNCFFFASLAFT